MSEKQLKIGGKTWDLTREPAYRKNFLESISRIGTAPMKAVRLYCYQCSGYSHAEVRACECRDCPLFVLKWNRNKRKAERKDLENKGVTE